MAKKITDILYEKVKERVGGLVPTYISIVFKGQTNKGQTLYRNYDTIVALPRGFKNRTEVNKQSYFQKLLDNTEDNMRNLSFSYDSFKAVNCYLDEVDNGTSRLLRVQYEFSVKSGFEFDHYEIDQLIYINTPLNWGTLTMLEQWEYLVKKNIVSGEETMTVIKEEDVNTFFILK